MAWRYSTGLRNALLEYAAHATIGVTAITISFGDGDGTGGRDTINDSGNGFGSIKKGDMITVLNSGSNNFVTKALAVPNAGQIEIAADLVVAEAAGAQVILVNCLGGSYAGIFKNGVMRIRAGAQPSSADDAETGTLHFEITKAGAVFVAGSPENGLNLGQVADGEAHKAIDPDTGVAELWSGDCLASGTIGWFRIYANGLQTGADATGEYVRLDGAISVSGGQLKVTSTTVTIGVPLSIDSVSLPLPESS